MRSTARNDLIATAIIAAGEVCLLKFVIAVTLSPMTLPMTLVDSTVNESDHCFLSRSFDQSDIHVIINDLVPRDAVVRTTLLEARRSGDAASRRRGRRRDTRNTHASTQSV